MLDIKVIRENPDRVKQAMKNRNGDYDEIIVFQGIGWLHLRIQGKL